MATVVVCPAVVAQPQPMPLTPAPAETFYPDGVAVPQAGPRAIATAYDNTNTSQAFAYPGEAEGVGLAFNGMVEAVQLGSAYVNGSALTQVSVCVRRIGSGAQSFKILLRLWDQVAPSASPGVDVVSSQIGSDLFYQGPGGAGFSVTAPFTAGFSLALPQGIVPNDRVIGVEVRLIVVDVTTVDGAIDPANTHPAVSPNCLSVQTGTGGTLSPLNPGPPSVGSAFPADGLGHLWRDITSEMQPPPHQHDGRYFASEDVADVTGSNAANLYLKVLTDVRVCATQNDSCGTATPISLTGAPPSSTTLLSQTNLGATVEYPAPPLCDSALADSFGVWYSFVGRGRVTRFTTCGVGAFNSSIRVFSGACSQLTCVSGAGDSGPALCSANPFAGTATVCAQTGEHYYILVCGATEFDTGAFNLFVSESLPCPVLSALDATGAVDLSASNPGCGLPSGPHGDCPSAVDAATCVTYFDRLTTGDVAGSPFRAADWFRYSIPAGSTGVTVRAIAEFPAVVSARRAASPGQECDAASATIMGDLDLVPGISGQLPLSGAPGEVFFVSVTPASWALPSQCGPGGTNAMRLTFQTENCPALADCFQRGAAGPAGSACQPALATHSRPEYPGGGWIAGGYDGAPDAGQCVADWDGDGCVVPADVSAFVTSWFAAVQQPGDPGGDLDCDGAVLPADVAVFVGRWFEALTAPASAGCV